VVGRLKPLSIHSIQSDAFVTPGLHEETVVLSTRSFGLSDAMTETGGFVDVLSFMAALSYRFVATAIRSGSFAPVVTVDIGFSGAADTNRCIGSSDCHSRTERLKRFSAPLGLVKSYCFALSQKLNCSGLIGTTRQPRLSPGDPVRISSERFSGSEIVDRSGRLSMALCHSREFLTADILSSICFGFSGTRERNDFLSSANLNPSDTVRDSSGFSGGLSCAAEPRSPSVAYLDLSSQMVFSNDLDLPGTRKARGSLPFECSLPVTYSCTVVEKLSYFDLSSGFVFSNDLELWRTRRVTQTRISMGESEDFTMSDLSVFSNHLGLRIAGPANASAHVLPSADLQQRVPWQMSTDFRPTAQKQSDVFYPSPFLSEMSIPAAQAPNGFTTLEISGIGIGLLILFCLLVFVWIRYCRKGGIAGARANRSLEYSDRDSDAPSDERALEFGPSVGKSTGKSTWSESESESDDPSI
jgi:hypothetical protein